MKMAHIKMDKNGITQPKALVYRHLIYRKNIKLRQQQLLLLLTKNKKVLQDQLTVKRQILL
jgi:hypothetical protein